jgi:hypothetical protein
MRAEVRGPSMMPVLHDGDRVLVNRLTYLFCAPQIGDVVLASMLGVPGEWAIKRVGGSGSSDLGPATSVRNHQACGTRNSELYFLVGDNPPRSTDSRHVGPVSRRNVLGRVWYRYWPPERRGWVL